MELNPEQFGFAISRSPLDYGGGYHPKRLELLHPGLGPSESPRTDHVTGYSRRVSRNPQTGRKYKTPKDEPVPGAHPKAAGFIDYTERPDGPFIHYMTTRSDLRGQGHGRQMVDKFYGMHSGAKEVDWGRIMDPAAEKMFNDRREQQEQPGYQGPRTYGKPY